MQFWTRKNVLVEPKPFLLGEIDDDKKENNTTALTKKKMLWLYYQDKRSLQIFL